MATRIKAILVDRDPGTHLQVFNSLPDDILLLLARTCDIDMGSLDHEHKKNITLERDLENRHGDPYGHDKRRGGVKIVVDSPLSD